MKICKWSFNGHNFDSEQKLDEYLKSHFNKDLKTGVKFSKDIKELLTEINKVASEKLKEDRAAALEKHLNNSKLLPYEDVAEVYDSGTVSVLNYISQKNLVQGFNMSAFKTHRRVELKKLYANEELSEKDLNTKVEEEINKEVNSWDYTRRLGKGLHFVVEKILKTDFGKHLGAENYKKQILKFAEEEGRTDITLDGVDDDLLNKFITKIARMKQSILKNDPSAKIFSEFTIDQEVISGLNIRGKIDFLVAHGDGTVDVIDLKVSSRNPVDYDQDRMETVEYQLGFYKRMLNAKGIPANKINLSILPITIGSSISNEIDSIYVDNLQVISPRTTVSYSINKEIGITENVVDTSLVEDTSKTVGEMFGVHTFNRGYSLTSVDEIFKRYVKKMPDGKFSFKNKLLRGDNIEYFETEEAVKAHIEVYLEELNQSTMELTTTITNGLKFKLDSFNGRNVNDEEKRSREIHRIYNSNVEEFDSMVPLNLKRRLPYITAIFNKYRKELGWRVEDNTELAQMGVILLVNSDTKEFDLISLTGYNVNTPVELKGQKNLLGNFYTDKQMEASDNTLVSSIGNIELIKSLYLANQMPKLYENGYKVGDLRVFNIDSDYEQSGVEALNYDKLVYNYNNLMANVSKGKNKIVFKDYYTKAFEAVGYIYDNLNPASDLGKLISRTATEKGAALLPPEEAIQKEIKLRELLELHKLLHEKYFSDKSMSKLESNSFEAYIYTSLSKALSYYTGTLLDPYNESAMAKYTGSWSERTILNGTYTNTADTIPVIKNLNRLLQATNNIITRRYTDYKNDNRKWFQEQYKKWGGFGSNAVVRNYTPSYEKFFDRSTDENKYDFRLKDPETDTTLNPDEKAFLKKFLELLNYHRYYGFTEDEIQEKKESGEYYRVPLVNSTSGYRILREEGLKNKAKAFVENSWINDLGLVNQTEEQRKLVEGQLQNKSPYEMVNPVADSDNSLVRSSMINGEDPFTKFEINLEEVLDNYVSSKIKQEEYNKMIPVFNSAVATLKIANFLFKKVTDPTIDYLNDYISSAILRVSLIDPELTNTHRVLSGLKSSTSKLILGGNYKSGVKEVMVSWITLANRAIANSLFDKTRPGVKDLQYAYGKVWIDSFKQVNPDEITLFEAMNFEYRMANMDMTEQVSKQNFNRSSLFDINSKLYWFNRAPDFLNRMTLLIAYMKKHDCLKAHTINENDELVYDWKKDGRFNLLAEHKSSDKLNEEDKNQWFYQRALYNRMKEEFISEGYVVKFTDKNGNVDHRLMTMDDDLPRAYTTKESESIHQEANTLFGYMDSDIKSLYLKKTIFIYLHQFQTYLSAKKNQWFLKRGKYAEGNYTHLKDAVTGELLYKQFNPETGEFIGLTTEANEHPHIVWTGRTVEGILWSLVDLFNVTDLGSLKEAWNDPVKLRNLVIASQDLAWILLLMFLASLLFDDDDRISKIGNKIFNNAASDLNIANVMSGAVTFSFPALDFISNTGNDIFKVFSGDLNPAMLPYRTINAIRDFAPIG